MEVGKYKFIPDRKTAVIATLIVLSLTSLGFWQVSRLNEKLGIENQINKKNSAEILDLNTDPLSDNTSDFKYRKVRVKGHFVSEGVTYIDNMAHNGDYGFYVYAPFKVEDSEKTILVNQGWIPYAGSRTNLPDVQFSTESQLIEGSIRIPSKRPFVPSSVDELKIRDKNLWLYMDLEKYAKEAPFQIYPFVIYQDSQDNSSFVREWPVFNSKAAMHMGYAIMWFSLAVIAFCIFVFGNLRKNGGE